MWLVHLSPGRLKRDVVMYVPPGKSVCGEQAAVRRQAGRDSCAIRRSGLTHRKVCRERRIRRDRRKPTAQQWHVVVTGTPLPHR
ncbi:hypothetical protein KZ779_00060 [Escherichia coli]|nr:hypothetical protein [Escherichia coli]